MNNMPSIVADFASGMQAAIAAQEANTTRMVDSITAAMRSAEQKRRDALADIRNRRREAGEIVAATLRDEERIEREYAAEIDGIHAALVEVRPQRVAHVANGLLGKAAE